MTAKPQTSARRRPLAVVAHLAAALALGLSSYGTLGVLTAGNPNSAGGGALALFAGAAAVAGACTAVIPPLSRRLSTRRRHLTPGLGQILVRDVTTVTIDEFCADLRTTGRSDGKPLSIGSVRRVHGVLHRALAQALRWEWIWHSPASTATPPTSQPVEMRPPSPYELRRLLSHGAKTNPLLHLFLVLAATTGARRGQLLALRWSDVDLDRVG